MVQAWRDRAPSLMLPLRLPGLATQLLILVALGKLYRAGRGLIPQQAALALHNGLTVVRLEQAWGIFVEWRVQALVLAPKQWVCGPLVMSRDALLAVLNHVYLDAHFIGTLLCLGWLYARRPRAFPVVRTVLVLSTGLALLIYIAFPMAPPRLMGTHLHLPHGYRMVDTLAPLLPVQRQQAELGFNPYAAMPSVHFTWALIVGATLVATARHKVTRVAGGVYPLLMLLTILVTGNHLILDAAGAAVVVVLAAITTLLIHPRQPHEPRAARETARPVHGCVAPSPCMRQ
ncbi:MAG: phosphatase PAP2 family protein [Chloroflexota bacterium]